MLYLVIFGFILFIAGTCIYFQIQANKHIKMLDRPYRVVKNALGQYLLQHYCKHNNSEYSRYDGGWNWETIKTYEDREEAIAMLNYKLVEFEKDKALKKQQENKVKIANKQKELAETIVEIVK